VVQRARRLNLADLLPGDSGNANAAIGKLATEIEDWVAAADVDQRPKLRRFQTALQRVLIGDLFRRTLAR